MNKYKINKIAIGQENELVLAVIQQAVKDLKKSAELFEYYRTKPKNNTFNKYNGNSTTDWLEFIQSGYTLIDELCESNIFELSYCALDNAYIFWIECIKRIANNNPNWWDYYSNRISIMCRHIERWKI